MRDEIWIARTWPSAWQLLRRIRNDIPAARRGKEDIKDIRRLTAAVERIAVKTEIIGEKVDGIDRRLRSVESAPRKITGTLNESS